jgi:hypothetical protein
MRALATTTTTTPQSLQRQSPRRIQRRLSKGRIGSRFFFLRLSVLRRRALEFECLPVARRVEGLVCFCVRAGVGRVDVWGGFLWVLLLLLLLLLFLLLQAGDDAGEAGFGPALGGCVAGEEGVQDWRDDGD